MPRPNISTNIVAAGGGLTGTAEGVIATSPPLTVSGNGARVRLLFTGVITMGASQTTVALKVERGVAAGGTQVGTTVTPAIAGGAAGLFAVEVEDTPGDVAGQQYVLTGTQAGGAGNATTANVSCVAITD